MVKKSISTGELLFYLEEVMSAGLSNTVEEELYEAITYEQPVNEKHLRKVMNRMYKWYEVKF